MSLEVTKSSVAFVMDMFQKTSSSSVLGFRMRTVYQAEVMAKKRSISTASTMWDIDELRDKRTSSV